MDRNEILIKIENCLIDKFGFQVNSLSENDYLIDDLGLDGFDVLDLANHIEDNFDIELSSQTIHKWKIVSDVIDSIVEYNDFRA